MRVATVNRSPLETGSHLPKAVSAAPRDGGCDHLHEATSRYDRDAKLLTMLLVCPVCRIETVVETLEYEPRLVPSVIPGGEKLAESGTSMASPNVANLAAKILAVNPKLTPVEVIALIRSTADRSADGRRVLINPRKAVAAAEARNV